MRHLPATKTELNEAQTQKLCLVLPNRLDCMAVDSDDVVESQLARERVDYLDLLVHGQCVVLVVNRHGSSMR